MNLRNPQKLLVKDMNYIELRHYVFGLEEEIYKLRHKARCHRKSMREMQRKLENHNLKTQVIDEWKMRKKIEESPALYIGLLHLGPGK